jgi:hypothetical protein
MSSQCSRFGALDAPNHVLVMMIRYFTRFLTPLLNVASLNN